MTFSQTAWWKQSVIGTNNRRQFGLRWLSSASEIRAPTPQLIIMYPGGFAFWLVTF